MLGKPTDTRRVPLFGMRIDALTMDEAVARLSHWAENRDAVCRYVVTPNVDHAVILRNDQRLQAAYRDASLVVADGWPLVLVSRLLGQPIPERVAGSDLVPELLANADDRHPLTVFLLGAAPGVADRAASRIESQWPNVRVVGTCSPPMGFENDVVENAAILHQVADANPDVLIIGLGAPKQELWIHQHRRQVRAAVAICAGATIDFLAGEKKRAPRWMRRVGLEWCHRMLADPRRLARRYARDAWVLPQLVVKDLLARSAR
ncbi:MAG: WecB/TagA/CpsF family glycosyltransferase [Planctomycetes bacterium]|nr:WecB/TagA/CpsF family glycosyltransferase [Planctomycetota bacterium]